ncbi:hypothetical protein [Frigoriglobus tundricola]|uniref:Uncharacterized protein n=1 Tax=Frigoriglobus tundricola TaxID=2774151 RepID=A0A6M5YWU8_9BACT|nr:hypothetical protein [Frigoriglobus tundricola]QJW98439.1 hypothetical protein FTUN_6029 [Frigoriglobus tundricola]
MLFVILIGLLVTVWCVVVSVLASYYGTPQFLIGRGRALWAWLRK